MIGIRDGARRALILVSALAVPFSAAVAVFGNAGTAVAATCSGDDVTTLSVAPAEAVNTVGEAQTISTHEQCGGRPGQGDRIVLVVRGPNVQTMAGLTDADGNLSFSYYGDNGPGTDSVAVCTTGLDRNVCTKAVVEWQCDDGYFANGEGCSRVPPIVLPSTGYGFSGFGIPGFADRFISNAVVGEGAHGLDDRAGAGAPESGAPAAAPAAVETSTAPASGAAPIEEVPQDVVAVDQGGEVAAS